MLTKNIANLIFEKLNIDIFTQDVPGAIYAVDDKNTSSHNVANIVKNASKEKVDILYMNLIYSWFFDCEALTKFSWGWTEENGRIKPLPFKGDTAFTNPFAIAKYRYGILNAQPDVFVLVKGDMQYAKLLYKFYKNVTGMQDEIVDEIILKFGDNVSICNKCISTFLNKVNDLDGIFLDASYYIKSILKIIKDVDYEFYLNATKKNVDIKSIYSDNQIIAILDKVFEMEE